MRARGPPVKQGKKVMFHGAFGTEADARIVQRKVKGFIKVITVRGHKRYVVMTKEKAQVR